MPEMTDAMYCHQQICIPPTFPYLLRQYAKAAIRTQPGDLLRWSAAYFRALAIGVPAPVKPRLEYPILKTHYGLTTGWLRTLLRQFAGYEDVSWPQLYDRWRGACLEVRGLVELVTMGQFINPVHIPWLRFVAIATAHLTQDLSTTMVLVCELLTEEPEGGSAAIPYNTFADLYKFLANIDATEEHTVRNFYFTESNLDLTKRSQIEEESEASSADRLVQEFVVEDVPQSRTDLQRYLDAIEFGAVEEEERSGEHAADQRGRLHSLDQKDDKSGDAPPKSDSEASCYVILDPTTGSICKEAHVEDESSSSSGDSFASLDQKRVVSLASKETISAVGLQPEDASLSGDLVVKSSDQVTPSSVVTELTERYSEVQLLPVPGIGPIVPAELVQAVLEYLRELADRQEGMVMPRNLRHFLCPPLEECPAH